MLHRIALSSLAVASALIQVHASAAYQVTARNSEVRKFSENNLFPPPNPNEVLGSTTNFNPFSVAIPFSTKFYQKSSLSPTGATYESYTSSSGSRQGPAGSGFVGSSVSSSFSINFTLTSAANFSLSGSLQRRFGGSVLLKLDSLTAGPAYNRSATALSDFGDNFAPTEVNWSGVLPTGNYRLSILDDAQRASPGVPDQGTASSFTFVIPAPTTAAPLLGAAMIAARRRRATR